MFCTKCGKESTGEAERCPSCGYPLKGPAYSEASGGEFGGLIPYKNTSALIAYYCAVFALIPCVGIPLGIAGVFLGVRGLRFADEHSSSSGKAHAWIGILLGGFCALANLVGVVLYLR